MSNIRASTQEGLILALRSEVDRLRGKINDVVSSAEMTVQQIHVENEAVRSSFLRREEGYLREIQERTDAEAHYKDLCEVTKSELRDETVRARATAQMLASLRESTLNNSNKRDGQQHQGIAEYKEDGISSSSSSSSSSSHLSHPGQLILRSTNSWAVEVARLRREAETQASQIISLQETNLSCARELRETKELCAAAKAEASSSLALLSEFQLAQIVLGKPKSRDQQLMSTIRNALSAPKASKLLQKDLVSACDDEKTERERHSTLYQNRLQELMGAWEERGGEGLHRALEALTERIAEANCLLSEKTQELEQSRLTAERQIAEKELVLQSLGEEHEHAARWLHEKDLLLQEQRRIRQEAARAEQAKEEAERSLQWLQSKQSLLVLESETVSSSLQAAQEQLQEALAKAHVDKQTMEELRLRSSQLEAEVNEYVRLTDGEHVGQLEGLLAAANIQIQSLQLRLEPLERQLEDTRRHSFEEAMALQKALTTASTRAKEEELRAEELRRKYSQLESEIERTNERTLRSDRISDQRRVDLIDAQELLATLEASNVALSADKGVLETKVSHFLTTLDDSANEVISLREKISTLEASCQALTSDKNALSTRLAEREDMVTRMEKEAKGMLKEIAGLKESLQSRTQALQTVSAAHASELLKLEEAHRKSKADLTQQRAETAARDMSQKHHIVELELKLAECEEQWRIKYESLHEEKRQLRADAETFIQRAAGTAAPLEARIKDLEETLEEERRIAEATKAELLASCDVLRNDRIADCSRYEAAEENNAARLEAAELALSESRGHLDWCRSQLREKMAALGEAERSCVATMENVTEDSVALQKELLATKTALEERNLSYSELQEQHVALQAECDEMKPHILELLKETELAEQQAREAELLKEQLTAAEKRADEAERQRAQQESSLSLERDASAARIAEVQALCLTKEARLKEILAFATQQIKVLEAAAVVTNNTNLAKGDEVRAQWRREVVDLQAKLAQEQRAHDQTVAGSRQEKEGSDRTESLLRLQIASLTTDAKTHLEKLREAEDKLQALAISTAQYKSNMGERLQHAEAQARYFERQALSTAEESRRRDADVSAHQCAARERHEDLQTARRQYEALLIARQADQRAFTEEMGELRANSQALLNEKCAALVGESEAASLALTHRLWEQHALTETAEEKIVELQAKVHAAESQQAILQINAKKMAEERIREQLQHQAELERMSAETAMAMSEQLDEKQKGHAIELAKIVQTTRETAERVISDLSTRLSVLEAELLNTKGENEALRSYASERDALRRSCDLEVSGNEKMSLELARVKILHADEIRALQMRLDDVLAQASRQHAEHWSSYQDSQPSGQLQRLKAGLETQIAELQEAATVASEGHARTLAITQKALYTESALLKQAQAELARAKEREERMAGKHLELTSERNEKMSTILQLTATHEIIVQQLQAEIDSLRQTSEASAVRVAELGREKLGIESELAKTRSEWETKHATALKTIDDTRLDREALEATVLGHEATLASLQRLLDETTAHGDRISSELDDATTQARAAKTATEATIQQLEGQLAVARQEIARAASERSKLTLQAESLQSKLSSVDRDCSSLRDHLKNADAQRHAADEASSTRLHEELVVLQQKLTAEHNAALETAERQRDQISAELFVAIEKINAEGQRALALESVSEDFVASIASLQRRVEEADAVAVRMQKENDEAQTQIAKLGQQIKAREAENMHARRADGAMIRGLQEDLESSRVETEALSASLAETESRTRRASEEQRRKMARIEQQLRDMQAAIDSRARVVPSALSPTKANTLSPVGSPTRTTQEIFSDSSEIDGSPFRHSAPVTGTAPHEELTRSDTGIADLRAKMQAGGEENNATGLLYSLTQALAFYDILRELFHRCEDEYNQAARILIETAEASHEKQRAKLEKVVRIYEAERLKGAKLKAALAAERADFRDSLESVRLRLVHNLTSSSGGHQEEELEAEEEEGEGEEGRGELFEDLGSVESETPSAFTINTDAGSI